MQVADGMYSKIYAFLRAGLYTNGGVGFWNSDFGLLATKGVLI